MLIKDVKDIEMFNRLAKDSPVMKKVITVLRKMSADEKELYEIEQREKAVRDVISVMVYEYQHI